MRDPYHLYVRRSWQVSISKFACRPNWGLLYQIHQTVEECKSQWSVVLVQGQHLRSEGMMQCCSFERQHAWVLRVCCNNCRDEQVKLYHLNWQKVWKGH